MKLTRKAFIECRDALACALNWLTTDPCPEDQTEPIVLPNRLEWLQTRLEEATKLADEVAVSKDEVAITGYQSTFTKKISLIRAVKESTGGGIASSRDKLAKFCPITIKCLSEEKAQEFKKKVTEWGVICE